MEKGVAIKKLRGNQAENELQTNSVNTEVTLIFLKI